MSAHAKSAVGNAWAETGENFDEVFLDKFSSPLYAHATAALLPGRKRAGVLEVLGSLGFFSFNFYLNSRHGRRAKPVFNALDRDELGRRRPETQEAKFWEELVKMAEKNFFQFYSGNFCQFSPVRGR
ncbi:hypothetical protein T07_13509 [Trichinella nelsoni]|uniref:Uncharacterized protein n=1 Tax=Trichinella nelsoni TaxID=6336 RepID=A0A0V0S1S9_9BILA|nr:hypothetical protein T07_13509 [Trichinella nelsoni]